MPETSESSTMTNSPLPVQEVERRRSINLNDWSLKKLERATGIVRDWYSFGMDDASMEGPLYTWTTPEGEVFHEKVSDGEGLFEIFLYRDNNGIPGELVVEST